MTTTDLRSRGFWPRRAGLAVLMGLLSVILWTGNPLFAVWVGSKVQAVKARVRARPRSGWWSWSSAR